MNLYCQSERKATSQENAREWSIEDLKRGLRPYMFSKLKEIAGSCASCPKCENEVVYANGLEWMRESITTND